MEDIEYVTASELWHAVDNETFQKIKENLPFAVRTPMGMMLITNAWLVNDQPWIEFELDKGPL